MRQEWQQQYENTVYKVDGYPDFNLVIGRPQLALSAWMIKREHLTACFITAYNPFSEARSEQENQEAQASLMQILEIGEHEYLQGVGVPVVGDWPPEPSFLVFGLSMEQTLALGRRFRQHAVVWFEPEKRAQLLWMD